MCGLCRVGEQALLALWGAERDGQGLLSLGTGSSQTQGCARTSRAPPPGPQRQGDRYTREGKASVLCWGSRAETGSARAWCHGGPDLPGTPTSGLTLVWLSSSWSQSDAIFLSSFH